MGSPNLMGENIPTGSVVYFLGAPGKVKIGYTSNLAKRFRNISTASPDALTLIGAVDGARGLERKLHALLQEHRVNGEWFADCAAVQETIHVALATGDVPWTENKKKKNLNPLVNWASDSLKKIAAPSYGEKIQSIVQRAANEVGFSYWRTFDLWYRKAHRLEPPEKQSIEVALRRTVS